ncbi:hypothetical protein OAC51_02085 [Flavobacteriaceae bacterium]|jgi:hypothetical protein|nr:hypothetical protein [Flavobacteriaceae bacterium]|tara:strand:+ start:51 stop:509 length:459 start_codon:yes stop_codon:yes gene_type:complete
MKIKHLPLYFLLALVSSSMWAQKSEKRMSFERLKALKINFIIEQVDLNTEEESFVWGAFEKHESDVRKQYHKKMRKLRYNNFKKTEDLSESQAAVALDSIYHLRTLKEELDQAFLKTLKTKLTAKQVLEIHIAEEKFHRKMVHRSRERKNIP